MITAGTVLTERLCKTGVNLELLCEVLQNHFLRSNGSADSLSFGDQDNPSIIIEWTRKGEIKRVIAARNLKPGEISDLEAAIETALLPIGKRFYRYALFSARPVTGAIGFEDWFQILPAPPSIPQPNSGWGDYVSVLEVCVEGSPLVFLQSSRAYREARTVEALLSALTVAGFRLAPTAQNWAWTQDPLDPAKPKYVPLGFSAPDTNGIIPTFRHIK